MVILAPLLLFLLQQASAPAQWSVQPTHLAIPGYPLLLARAHGQGSVQVELDIDSSGQVRTIKTVSSAHPLFEKAVREALASWRFVPAPNAESRHQPLTVKFTLDSTADPNDTTPVRSSLVAPGLVEVITRIVVRSTSP